eukprot:5667972-Alexandrium_andersonii.AAC.1
MKGLRPRKATPDGRDLAPEEYAAQMARFKIRARLRWNELDDSNAPRFEVHELEAITAMADDV